MDHWATVVEAVWAYLVRQDAPYVYVLAAHRTLRLRWISGTNDRFRLPE